MEYIPIAFLAGLLTVLAPCVFTLLPVVLGGSLTGSSWKKPATIIASLSVSVFVFTLILKASTALIYVPPQFWTTISGGILIGFGIITLFPSLWTKIDTKLGLSSRSDGVLHKSKEVNNSFLADVLVGAALGPVFSSCSPTYSLIIATILPLDFGVGVLNLLVYIIGMAIVLSAVAIFGQGLIKKLKWAANPNGWFKKFLGILFIVVGIAVFTGFDKRFETFLLDQGLFDVTVIENRLLEEPTSSSQNSEPKGDFNIEEPYAAAEIQGIQTWINSDPLTLESLKGKVVLIDFWTYSCINCIRTTPFIESWYEKYKDEGLVVIGIHAPEFAFEKVESNVREAVVNAGITYPVALDNDFTTWRAYNNRYWPAHYFIDRDGQVRHTHFGEGEYDESEKVIQELLGLEAELIAGSADIEVPVSRFQTPETYLGYSRLENLVNFQEAKGDEEVDYQYTPELPEDFWSLEGKWTINSEAIVSGGDSVLRINFTAKNVYLVMGSDAPVDVKISVVGDAANEFIKTIKVNDYKLYELVDADSLQNSKVLEIEVPKGVSLNAFTFGS